MSGEPLSTTTSSPGARPIVTFGETMAFLTSERPGPLAHASGMTLGIGGSESNVAIGLARLGHPVVWIGRVGDDAFGHLVAREIRGEGVSTIALVDPHAPTGLMVKERRTSSIQRVTYYRAGSAGSALRPEDVPDDIVRGASVLHVTGITAAVSASARAAVLRSVDIAVGEGVPVSFDLNFRSALWSKDDALDFYRKLIPLTDVVFASPDEAAIVVGDLAAPSEIALALEGLGAGSAVVKLGADGAVASRGGMLFSRAAFAVPAMDTVGAGDAFVAGYLAAFTTGGALDECLELASAVAAFVCMSPGDWEGLPRRDELPLLLSTDPVSR
jgi:2-dehydro-3-deoxygluconokinase